MYIAHTTSLGAPVGRTVGCCDGRRTTWMLRWRDTWNGDTHRGTRPRIDRRTYRCTNGLSKNKYSQYLAIPDPIFGHPRTRPSKKPKEDQGLIRDKIRDRGDDQKGE